MPPSPTSRPSRWMRSSTRPTTRCSEAAESTARYIAPPGPICSPSAYASAGATPETRKSPAATAFPHRMSFMPSARYGVTAPTARRNCWRDAIAVASRSRSPTGFARSRFRPSAAGHTDIRSGSRFRSRSIPCAASTLSTRSIASFSHAPVAMCSRRTRRYWARRASRSLLRVGAFFVRLGGRLRDLEHLAEIGDVRGIVIHRFRRLVANLGNGLPVASCHLDDDLDRLVAEIIGQIGADAECGVAAPLEILKQPNRQRHVECVRENHGLGSRVDTHLGVVCDEFLAPFERITGIVTHAIEQLAKEEIEVAQERFHPAYVGQRDTEIASILARPGVERKDLRIAQPRPDRLTCLQVLVRHCAQRGESVLECKVDVARADEFRADALLEREKYLLLPAAGKTPPSAVIGAPKLRVADRVDLFDLCGETPAPFRKGRSWLGVAKVDLADDRQQRNLEQYGMQPGPVDRDLDLVGRHRGAPDLDEAILQMKQAEQIDEVALEKAPAAQILELAPSKAQAAKAGDLALDLGDVRGQGDVWRAALEPVLDLRFRKIMQHDLHHRELVQIRVEQRINDHAWSRAGRSVGRWDAHVTRTGLLSATRAPSRRTASRPR